MTRIKNKIALVTGGGNGIGKAIANRFAEEGAIVIITDKDTSAGQSVAFNNKKIEFFQQDVVLEDDWKKTIDHVLAKHLRLDILVNNAGILATDTSQELTDTSLKQWRDVHAVNSDGVFLGCKYGVEAMQETGGSIVNLSSVAGLIGSPNLVAYGASKGAVRQLTKSIALHCGKEELGIRCNSVHPGIIRTDMGDQVMSLGKRSFEEEWAGRISLNPLKEAGTVEDIANCVLFLASDEARHITGAEIVVDGGRTIS